MRFGCFTMPSHPPERALKDGHEWDLRRIRWLDELGFTKRWIGERTKPDTMFGFLKLHIKPLQTPNPPIGVP